ECSAYGHRRGPLFGSHVTIYPDKISRSIHPDKILVSCLLIRQVTDMLRPPLAAYGERLGDRRRLPFFSEVDPTQTKRRHGVTRRGGSLWPWRRGRRRAPVSSNMRAQPCERDGAGS